jgi:hypothetical protein
MNGAPDDRYYGVPPGAEGRERRSDGRTRLMFGLVAIAFAVTLAVAVAQRLSDQAMAVLAGAVCGVGASIPTSLLIFWATRRKAETRPLPPTGYYPPVVVVQPPAQSSGFNPYTQGYLPPLNQAMPRDFTVVGSEEV